MGSWSIAQDWQPTRVSGRPVRHISNSDVSQRSPIKTRAASAATHSAQPPAQVQTGVSAAVRWQPDRTHAEFQPQFKPTNTKPVSAATNVQGKSEPSIFEQADATPENNNTVALRWISKDSATQNNGQPSTEFPQEPAFSDIATQEAQSVPPRVAQSYKQVVRQQVDLQQVVPASYPQQNSLRSSQGQVASAPVRTASYQDPVELQFGDIPELPELAPQPPAGTSGFPDASALPDANALPGADAFPDASSLPELGTTPDFQGNPTQGLGDELGLGSSGAPEPPTNTLPSQLPDAQTTDQLQVPEDAPPPAEMSDRPQNPFPDQLQGSPSDGAGATSDAEISGGNGDQLDALPNPRQDRITDPDLTLPDRSANSANSPTCSELRERLRQRPISRLSLDTAPVFGEGLRSVGEDNEGSKLNFAANSPVRDWRDVSNKVIARGRLVDMRNEQIVLDVGGSEMELSLLKLSDTDIDYIGDAWNIPASCGVGNVAFEGRQFIASTVQFTAPGNCHKPLYFQQVQLERYGHTAGPVVQPLISTAHFFGNIAVLPYSMGIHPPNECQYSLGYYRPGNCAPYMLQPVPISLRGALSQATFTTGFSALIP